MAIHLDLQNYVRQFVDMGSESYEKKTMRVAIKFTALALFVLLVWKLLIRRG